MAAAALVGEEEAEDLEVAGEGEEASTKVLQVR